MEQIKVSALVLDGNARPIEDTESFKRTLLYNSIKKFGRVVSPIIVYKKDGNVIVWDGGRRVTAARLLNIPEVPFVEVDPPEDDSEAAVTQVVYNNHRENLTYLQRAGLMKRLKDAGYTQVAIAEKFGETTPEVSLALKTLQSHPALQEAIDLGKVSPSAIEPLLPLPLEVQGRLADTAVREKTTRKIRALVNTYKLEEKRWVAAATTPEDTYIPEGYDPMELLVLEELEEARKHLENARLTELTHRDFRNQGRKSIVEVIHIAENLGKKWNN